MVFDSIPIPSQARFLDLTQHMHASIRSIINPRMKSRTAMVTCNTTGAHTTTAKANQSPSQDSIPTDQSRPSPYHSPSKPSACPEEIPQIPHRHQANVHRVSILGYLLLGRFSLRYWLSYLCRSQLFLLAPCSIPKHRVSQRNLIGGAVLFFVGATLFQVGTIFLVFEAVNENQKGCFGWPVRELLCEADPSGCAHHHQRNDKGKGQLLQRRWQWWLSWHELCTYYIYEVGFIANISLAVGATIFYITGILVLLGVYSHLSQGVLWGVYWLSYLVGSVLFVFWGI